MKLTLTIISALCCFLGTGVQGLRSRVNGGQNARVGDFKYIVGIKIKHFLDPSYCTGSIIAEKFILTAAHCFTENDKKNKDGTYSRKFEKTEVVVYANVIGLDTEYRKSTHEIKRKGVSVYFVPDYFKNGVADIAVLELDSALSFQEGLLEKLVRPGPSIDGFPPGTPSLYENAKGVLAGYGANEVGKNNNKLKWIYMNVVPYGECQIYEDWRLINKAQFVCGKGDAAPFSGCPGDSGAPLVVKYNSKLKNTKTVIGVLSHGASCSDKQNDPNVFIRVSHYNGFITHAILKLDSSPRVKKHELKK